MYTGVLGVLGNDLLSTHLLAHGLPTPARKLIFRHATVHQVLFTYTPSDPRVAMRYDRQHEIYVVLSSSPLFYAWLKEGPGR